MKYTVSYGQTIFDVALIAYSDASLVYRLMAENPQIENINSDLTGMELSFTQVTSSNPKEALKLQQPLQPKVVISSTQSIIDIALQYTGSAENVYDIILGNQLGNILSDPTGVVLNYTLSNDYVCQYYRANAIAVSTKPLSATSSEGSLMMTEGGQRLIQENGFYILLE